MYQIQNNIFSLSIDPQRGTFDILIKDKKFPSLEKVRLGCTYLWRGIACEGMTENWQVDPSESGLHECAVHGKVDTLAFQIPADEHGISIRFALGIVQDFPLVIWRMKVSNSGSDPVQISSIDLARVEPAGTGRVSYPSARSISDLGFFSNGWQSWSPARWYAADSTMQISRLGFLQHPMIYNPGTPLPRRAGLFSSDMFAVIGDREVRTGFVVGFLSQIHQFGSILADFQQGNLRMWANGDEALLEPGKSIKTDDAVFNPILLDHRDPLDKYLEAVARENHVKFHEETPVGWCSWYHFYTHVKACDVEKNLKMVLDYQERLPLPIVQIDDGFEKQVGDWFEFKSTFPDGVEPLAADIKREGLIPGLWLAPFIVHRQSDLFKKHPDWILRQSNGRPVNAGWGWDSLTTGIDLTVQNALEYACDVVGTASKKWGFSFLKLDFLYAAALNGKYHDPTKTRAQVMRMGMEAIRNTVGPNVSLLGCGAPLGSMLGLVDSMRIGPDVKGDWTPKFHGIGAFIKSEPSFPSARNSIHNVVTRANLHRRWWVNDPDCLLVRPDTRLSLDEVHSLATTIAMTGGSLLISDDLPKLPVERLMIAEVMLPVLDERARVVDWFDSNMPEKLRLDLLNATGEWHMLAVFNWLEQARDIKIFPDVFQLSSGTYLTREFWTGNLGEMSTETPWILKAVPAHGCALIAARRLELEKPLYQGSTLHFSQGMEVVDWCSKKEFVKADFRLPRNTSGKIFIHFPGTVCSAEVNHMPARFKKINEHVCCFDFHVDGFATLEVHWL